MVVQKNEKKLVVFHILLAKKQYVNNLLLWQDFYLLGGRKRRYLEYILSVMGKKSFSIISEKITEI